MDPRKGASKMTNVMDDRERVLWRLEQMEKEGTIDKFDFAVLHILRVSLLTLSDAIRLADILV
ncbi:hypothetical protein FJZ27_02625 [Candidatus Peribacteria bacterium]|nr:hypothetical protein [Candidatus Peribacteria bacterium]